MGFPVGTPVVTLTGTLPSAVAGTGYGGQVVLTPSAVLTDTTRHAVYPGGGKADIVDGTFTVQLIPNDAAGIGPDGWRWYVDLQPSRGQRLSFWADIHGTNGTTIHLDDLVPTQAPGGGTIGEPGKTAYEIAVDEGFTGTVTEWLASLVGPEGEQGQQGETGPQPSLGAAGAGSTIALRSDDPSTTNARTPTAHAASHGSGGSDPVTPAAIGADPAGAAASAVTVHAADTTGVHGIPDTSVLETVTGAQGKADDAQAIATTAAAADAAAKVTAHTNAADPHGDRAWADAKFALGVDLTALGGTVNGLATSVGNLDTFVGDCLTRVQNIEQGTAWLSGLNVNGNAQITGRLTADGFALPMLPRATRAPRFREAGWRQIFASGHGWTASGSGVASSNVNDTATFIKGTQSFQMVTTGTGAVANIRRYGATAFDLTNKAIRLVFRVADVSRINQINFLVGTSTLANSYSWRVFTHATTAQNQVQSGEWVTVTLQWSGVRSPTGAFTVGPSGIPSNTGALTDMAFQVVDKGGAAPATVNLQSVEIIDGTVATFPNGAVSITFDDCYSSVWNLARPAMDARGYRGTIYTIADVIDTSGVYLTTANLRAMQDAGWDIAGHAYTVAAHNAKYTTLSTAAVLDELRQLRAWMVARGFPSEHFAYPGGWFGPTTDGDPIDQLTARYFSTGRGISSADNASETHPPGAPFRMRSISGIGSMAGGASPANPTTMLAAGGALDRTASTGAWTILTFHEIVAGTAATTNQCSVTDFNSIMDGIATRGIKVLPVSDIYRND